MEGNELPRVLVVGINAWREDGTAHTLMDIFRCWDPDRLALIYTRADLPYTAVCNHYFRISESSVLRSIFRRHEAAGERVCNTAAAANATQAHAEHRRYARAHKLHSDLLPLLREAVWKLGRWKSKALREFIAGFNPDIIFLPIYPTAYMGRIQRYVSRLTGKPTVCYLADDNYSYDSCSNIWKYLHRLWLRHHVGPIARACRQMFVIVDKEKEDTDRRFGTDSIILTKGIDFSGRTYRGHVPGKTIRFVYTGNLLIGRDKTLAMLADVINRTVGSSGATAELYIYSQTEPSGAILARLNRGNSHFCGRISRDDVQRVQQRADVVVFAEALAGKEANAAKLSFSTKITDYLANGKCILAIGRPYIAPVDYFRRNDAAVIATSEQEIESCVKAIVGNPGIIDAYGRKAFATAQRNHDRKMLDRRFVDAMMQVCSDEKDMRRHNG